MNAHHASLAALLLIGAVSLVGSREHDSASLAPPTGDLLRVRVIDLDSERPVSGARVVSLSFEDAARDAGGEDALLFAYDFDEARERLGVVGTTDERGIALLPRGDGLLYLAASTRGKWAQTQCYESDEVELILERDETLSVVVVGDDLLPRGAVPVSLISRFPSRPGSTGPREILAATAWSDPLDGLARFRHVQALVGRHVDGCEQIARLGLPLGDEVERTLGRSGTMLPPRLVLPPTGRVTIHFPTVGSGRARLTRLAGGGEVADRRQDRAAGRRAATAVVNGRAEFPHVGLGLDLEYELVILGSLERFRGSFHGPRSAGQHVEVTWEGRGDVPTLTGRVFSKDLQPIVNEQLSASITTSTESDAGYGSSSRGVRVRTDAEGRFRFSLAEAKLPPGHRIRFAIHRYEERARFEADVSDDLRAGLVELGDVFLLPPGSDVVLRRQSDAELEESYRRARLDRRQLETCLTEMVRRGGDAWAEFLTEELASCRAERRPWDDRELALLTALCRVQGERDPLALELLDEPPFECTFPGSPLLHYRLVAGGDRILVAHDEDPIGAQPSFRVVAVDEAGLEVQPLPSSQYSVERSTLRRLQPGESLRGMLPLAAYVQLPHPGEYRVRILYHGSEAIASEDNVRGWITSRSPEFTVRVHPLRVELTRTEHARRVAWIRAIDVERPVPLVGLTWSTGLYVAGSPSSPEDRLFRAGWSSLPALLETLEDDDLDPQLRGWVLGMLWNLTGALLPTGHEFHDFETYAAWTGVDANGSREPRVHGSFSGLRAGDQAALTRRWLELRGMVVPVWAR